MPPAPISTGARGSCSFSLISRRLSLRRGGGAADPGSPRRWVGFRIKEARPQSVSRFAVPDHATLARVLLHSNPSASVLDEGSA
jgi:hypothetical protein